MAFTNLKRVTNTFRGKRRSSVKQNFQAKTSKGMALSIERHYMTNNSEEQNACEKPRWKSVCFAYYMQA
jgi:hypothetical protein